VGPSTAQIQSLRLTGRFKGLAVVQKPRDVHGHFKSLLA